MVSLDRLVSPSAAWKLGRVPGVIEALLPKFGPAGRWASPVPQISRDPAPTPAKVREAMARLPQPYAGVLRLHDGHRMPLNTLASRLNVPPATVRQILHHARMAFLAMLAEADSGATQDAPKR